MYNFAATLGVPKPSLFAVEDGKHVSDAAADPRSVS
jgi:hypothetical protein